jgi:molybdopterin-guanine dinucleotide biosynthesis protein MobB
MLADLPVFAICGHSNSGKTTVIEALLARMRARGLAVAVAKFHAHGIDIDRPGKDSDRFFRAGADILLQGPDQGFLRTHPPYAAAERQLAALARRHDLVLVEGRRHFPCDKVWLLGDGETGPPSEAGRLLACLPRDVDRAEIVWNILQTWLPLRWVTVPVHGCILIGGRSSRMGRPKHLIRRGGKTWLERAVECLQGRVERTVLVGAGDAPRGLSNLTRLPDAPDAEGPMAGLLAAMRWAPWASWLAAACDLPNLSAGAAEWLLSTRAPGAWATLPRLPREDGVEPLLAHYDFRARELLEALAAEGKFSPSSLAGHPKVISPAPPEEISAAWENVNTPAHLARIERHKRRAGRSDQA